MPPGPARILPPRACANPSRARPPAISAQTISARTHPNPAQPPQTTFCTSEFNPCTPEPKPPRTSRHLNHRPHPLRPPPQARPAVRPPLLRSGSRPGAAPAPPSGSLPEDRHHPVNAALGFAVDPCHGSRLFILWPRARHVAPMRPHPPAARTREPEPAWENEPENPLRNEPGLVGLWHGGGAPPLCRGVARGVGDRNAERQRRSEGTSPSLSVIPPRIHRSPNG